MQDLSVIGVENGALLVASDSGERFRIVIDELLQSRLRQGIASGNAQTTGKKASPRDIQAHIRAGLSAIEVAELTGASLDYVERFEGPVVAERQFIVDSALRVAVQPTSPADPLGEEPLSTFGEAIEDRLESLEAEDVRWASWKDETGWIVKLTFISHEIDHDARWQFDPKRHALVPLGNEAVTLSRHGELTEGLIPRLRAVSALDADESSRFDSGAFEPVERAEPRPVVAPAEEQPADPVAEAASVLPPAPVSAPMAVAPAAAPWAVHKESSKAVDAFAIKRAPDEADTADHNQTADLLEALRRRRGEREAASFEPPVEAESFEPVFSGPRSIGGLTDTPLEGLEAELVVPPQPVGLSPKSGQAKRQRAAMPSWDEIVFGARSEDDPA
jgi:hypothetical protein